MKASLGTVFLLFSILAAGGCLEPRHESETPLEARKSIVDTVLWILGPKQVVINSNAEKKFQVVSSHYFLSEVAISEKPVSYLFRPHAAGTACWENSSLNYFLKTTTGNTPENESKLLKVKTHLKAMINFLTGEHAGKKPEPIYSRKYYMGADEKESYYSYALQNPLNELPVLNSEQMRAFLQRDHDRLKVFNLKFIFELMIEVENILPDNYYNKLPEYEKMNRATLELAHEWERLNLNQIENSEILEDKIITSSALKKIDFLFEVIVATIQAFHADRLSSGEKLAAFIDDYQNNPSQKLPITDLIGRLSGVIEKLVDVATLSNKVFNERKTVFDPIVLNNSPDVELSEQLQGYQKYFQFSEQEIQKIFTSLRDQTNQDSKIKLFCNSIYNNYNKAFESIQNAYNQELNSKRDLDPEFKSPQDALIEKYRLKIDSMNRLLKAYPLKDGETVLYKIPVVNVENGDDSP